MKIYAIETEVKDFKNQTLDLQDIIYDLFGHPLLEYNLKEKSSRHKLFTELKYYLDTNTPMFITNHIENEDETPSKQTIYPILSIFGILEEHVVPITDKILDKSDFLNKSNEEFKKDLNAYYTNELCEFDESLNTCLLKLMIFNEKDTELKTEYNHRVLLDGNKEELADMLYPPSSNSFTYICNTLFNQQLRKL